jgi:hypothetical protein
MQHVQRLVPVCPAHLLPKRMLSDAPMRVYMPSKTPSSKESAGTHDPTYRHAYHHVVKWRKPSQLVVQQGHTEEQLRATGTHSNCCEKNIRPLVGQVVNLEWGERQQHSKASRYGPIHR